MEHYQRIIMEDLKKDNNGALTKDNNGGLTKDTNGGLTNIIMEH
jgi:hypothetical protein